MMKEFNVLFTRNSKGNLVGVTDGSTLYLPANNSTITDEGLYRVHILDIDGSVTFVDGSPIATRNIFTNDLADDIVTRDMVINSLETHKLPRIEFREVGHNPILYVRNKYNSEYLIYYILENGDYELYGEYDSQSSFYYPDKFKNIQIDRCGINRILVNSLAEPITPDKFLSIVSSSMTTSIALENSFVDISAIVDCNVCVINNTYIITNIAYHDENMTLHKHTYMSSYNRYLGISACVTNEEYINVISNKIIVPLEDIIQFIISHHIACQLPEINNGILVDTVNTVPTLVGEYQRPKACPCDVLISDLTNDELETITKSWGVSQYDHTGVKILSDDYILAMLWFPPGLTSIKKNG